MKQTKMAFKQSLYLKRKILLEYYVESQKQEMFYINQICTLFKLRKNMKIFIATKFHVKFHIYFPFMKFMIQIYHFLKI